MMHAYFHTSRITLTCAVLATLLWAAGCGSHRDMEALIICVSADGLAKGMPVTSKGFEIGKVKGIDLLDDGSLAMKISIDGKYRQLVKEDSQFKKVLPLSFLIDDSSESTGEIVMMQGRGATAENGARFTLQYSSIDLFFQSLGAISGLVDDGMAVEIERFRESAEAAMAEGAHEWERQRPELEKRVKAIGAELEQSGNPSAGQVVEELMKILDSSPE